jgi:hypothetical protein
MRRSEPWIRWPPEADQQGFDSLKPWSWINCVRPKGFGAAADSLGMALMIRAWTWCRHRSPLNSRCQRLDWEPPGR